MTNNVADNMNVVVLLAGKGKRFANYAEHPKPMIDVKGTSILKRTTDSLPWLQNWPKLTFVVLQEHIDKFKIDEWLTHVYGKNAKIMVLAEPTRGNLETAKIAAERIALADPTALHEPILFLDGDNAYDGNSVAQTFSDFPSAGVYYFDPLDDDSHWCFAMERNGRVYDLHEKNAYAVHVGGKPMIGVFYFNDCSLFLSCANDILVRNETVSNEFFMSLAVRDVLDRNIAVFGHKVTNVVPLGTPEDVLKLISPEQIEGRKITICLDLDDTINFCKAPAEQYGNELLQNRAVAILQKWKADGHYIIIHTARNMNTSGGNVGKALARQGLKTLQWLEKNNVPYDEIWWSKPHADIFIDDKAFHHEIGNWDATERAVEKFLKKGK